MKLFFDKLIGGLAKPKNSEAIKENNKIFLFFP